MLLPGKDAAHWRKASPVGAHLFNRIMEKFKTELKVFSVGGKNEERAGRYTASIIHTIIFLSRF
jgi:hypothetical protein